MPDAEQNIAINVYIFHLPRISNNVYTSLHTNSSLFNTFAYMLISWDEQVRANKLRDEQARNLNLDVDVASVKKSIG